MKPPPSTSASSSDVPSQISIPRSLLALQRVVTGAAVATSIQVATQFNASREACLSANPARTDTTCVLAAGADLATQIAATTGGTFLVREAFAVAAVPPGGPFAAAVMLTEGAQLISQASHLGEQVREACANLLTSKPDPAPTPPPLPTQLVVPHRPPPPARALSPRRPQLPTPPRNLPAVSAPPPPPPTLLTVTSTANNDNPPIALQMRLTTKTLPSFDPGNPFTSNKP